MSIERFRNLPDINFVNKDIETMLTEAVAEYETAYYQQTGERKTLAPADPIRIWIYAQVLKLYGAYQLIDFSAKQNLLKYSQGAVTEHLGALVGVTKNLASYAVVTQRFSLSAPQLGAISIPQGTLVTPGNGLFFETTVYGEIPAGDLYIDVIARCTEPGTIGNGFVPGQINILVEPIPYIISTSNVDISQGGEEEESNESLKEKIFLKPESFSVAGPRTAYEYFVKEYNQSIIDVTVSSPSPVSVDIRFILQNGEIPDSALITEVGNYISADNRRPLTDLVTVQAPEQVVYNIGFTYYIKSSDQDFAENIQAAVTQAVNDYIIWQKTKIGRDINPSELISRVVQAGAKRVVLTSPAHTQLSGIQVAKEGTVTVTYGGLEDE